MTLEETIRLIETLHIAGVKKFKSLEHDIVLGDAAAPIKSVAAPAPPANPETVAQVQELISTLQLPPEQLINLIFPDGAE